MAISICMKNHLLVITLSLFLFASCEKDGSDPDNNNPGTNNNTVNKGLIAYYPFNGDANDSSGNNYHLSVTEAVLASDRFGKSASAYNFNGAKSYMTIPKLIKADSLREFTISLWVKPDVLQTQRMLSFFANPGVAFCNHYSGFVQHNGQYLLWHELVASYYANGCSMADNFDAVANPVGKWSHIILVQRYNIQNASDKRYNYSHYLNGTKLKTVQSGGQSESNPMAVKLSLGGFIGCGVGYMAKFSGSIDDVRIYDRALSDEELLQLYNLTY